MFRTVRPRSIEVHGQEIVDDLDDFYGAVAQLFQDGAIAGLSLFFTALAAAAGPLAMAAVSDVLGDIRYGFMLAGGFALLLCAALLWNLVNKPAAARLLAAEQA